jgi:DMSO/TMAO reductase YedYZ heme-binding membrane subunit
MHNYLLIHSLHNIIASNIITISTKRVAQSWPWYVIRGAGLVAAGLIFLLMLSGIGQVTGATYRFIEPIKAWAIHRALAITLCLAVSVHVGFLLLDHFVSFSLIQLFFPFISHYNNGTSLYGIPLGGLAITLGVLAMYGLIIIILSSLGWINTRKKQWKKLHYLSYIVAFFIFLHAIYAGSDLKYGLFRKFWIGLGIIVIIGVLSRLLRTGTTTNGNS